jgi:hypothetical protein
MSGRAPAQSSENVLVVTRLGELSSRTGISQDELRQKLEQVGEVFDVQISGNMNAKRRACIQAVQAHVAAKKDEPYTAIQIVGGDGVIPYGAILNVAWYVEEENFDPVIFTDDEYGDTNNDSIPELPIARLPDGGGRSVLDKQFAAAATRSSRRSGAGLLAMSGKADRFLEASKQLAKAAGVSESAMLLSPPHTLKKDPPKLNKDSAITALLVHGSAANTARWWGEAKAGDQPEAFSPSLANSTGVVLSESCYGGFLVESDYTMESLEDWAGFRNGKSDIVKYGGKPLDPSNSIALHYLESGAECFIGATAVDYPDTATEIAKEVFDAVRKGDDPLKSFLDAKRTVLNRTESDCIAEKIAHHFQYYGLVPVSMWKSPPGPLAGAGVSTSLVFDVSGTMGNQFNGSEKLQQAQKAGHDITKIIKNTSQKENQTGEVAVSSFDSVSYRNQDFTSDYDLADTAIDNLRVGSSTNLSAGIESGLDQLDSSASGTTKVMLLLSDGQANAGVTDPDAIIAGPVQRAKDAGVQINVIGFGEPGDLNEDLLERIASETGGEYTLANSSSIGNSIASLFIKYQMKATHTVLGEYSGTVSQGAVTSAGQFTVPLSGNLTTVLNWPGSELELRFTDPKGTEVASGYPGLSVSTGRPLSVYIDGAAPGTWTVSVYGKQVSMDEEPYYALVAFKEATSTVATVAPVGGGGGPAGGGAEIWLLFIGVALAGGVGWVVVGRRQSDPLETSSAYSGSGPGSVPAGSRFNLVDASGQSYPLRDGSNTVGRSGASEVTIADPTVSRDHAIIVVSGSTLSVRDLDSSLGTYVNGSKIVEGALAAGDELRFGEATLTVHAAAPDLVKEMSDSG